MNIKLRTDKENIDWQAVADLLSYYGLSQLEADTQRKVFENSAVVAFLYDGDRLIGCGRALSDGICQAAVYNIALAEEYRGMGLGRKLIGSVLEQVKGCTVVLYTHPKTVAMYEKFGFRRQKTGMVILNDDPEKLAFFEKTGFILPKNYRFGDSEYDS